MDSPQTPFRCPVAAPGFTVVPDGVAPQAAITLRSVRKTITPAQLRALAATQITVIPAPGAGFANVLVAAHFFLDYGTTAHNAPTNAGDDFALRYTDGSGQLCGTQEANGFIDASADAHRWMPAGAVAVGTAINVIPVENAPVVLDNAGSAEFAGTGDSPLIIEAVYWTIPWAIS